MPQRTRDPGALMLANRKREPRKPFRVKRLRDLAEPLMDTPLTYQRWCEANGYTPETRTYRA